MVRVQSTKPSRSLRKTPFFAGLWLIVLILSLLVLINIERKLQKSTTKELSQKKDTFVSTRLNQLQQGYVQSEASEAIVDRGIPRDNPHIKANRESQGSNVDVAYAITITSCDTSVLDGAAVLAESIAATQQPGYQLIAIIYDQGSGASVCQAGLAFLGFQTEMKGLPFAVTELKHKTKIQIIRGGCCGASEYLKLYAFAFVEYDVVIHLDIDVLLLKSLDPLIDHALKGSDSHYSIRTIPSDAAIGQRPEFIFVREYTAYNPNEPTNRVKNGIQGAFFLVRPSLDRFEDLLRVLRESSFDHVLGWNSLGFGGYWGHAQIQGFLSYYYYALDNLTSSIELDPCRYNTLGHDLRFLKEDNLLTTCRTGERTCEDCSKTPFEEIYMAHLSLCKKPWWCPQRLIRESVPLCAQFYRRWFEFRKDVDKQLLGLEVNITDSNSFSRMSLGYCSDMGRDAYRSLRLPLENTTHH